MSELVRVLGIAEESYDTRTIEFRMDGKAVPGQFVMAWVPGMEEIPMSLSGTGRIKSVTVKGVGPSSRKLLGLTAGDVLGVRGPYGNGYRIDGGRRYLAVGGGVGAASIMPAVEDSGADVIIGARSGKDIIFADRARKCGGQVWLSTDDGSCGFRGNAVQLMRKRARDGRYDCVIACGPPVMLHSLYEACVELDLDCQLSLERHMKCGAGICGCCAIDGQRVCKDGPVFTKEQIARMPEFGCRKRDECGRPVMFRR